MKIRMTVAETTQQHVGRNQPFTGHSASLYTHSSTVSHNDGMPTGELKVGNIKPGSLKPGDEVIVEITLCR